MKNSLLLLTIIAVAFSTAVFGQRTRKKIVQFDTEQSVVTPQLAKTLDHMYNSSQNLSYLKVEALPNITNNLSIPENNVLSKQRAEAVYAYYLASGVEEDMIRLKCIQGSKTLLPEEVTDPDSKQNWQVEVKIFKQDQFLNPNLYEHLAQEDKYGDITTLCPQRKQLFTIVDAKNEEITGNKGTIVVFNKNSFMHEDGSDVKGKVKIYLTEYYDYSDMLFANLTTSSRNRMLETGGMVHISATSGGDEVFLKPGETIEIKFPTRNRLYDMHLFAGQPRDENDIMDWAERDSWDESESYDEWEGEYYGELDGEYYETYSKSAGRLDYYILHTAELGWINCDRFNEETNKADFFVSIDTTFAPAVRMVFKDIKSVMPGYVQPNGQIKFDQLPVGQRATVVAFCVKNDVPYLSTQEVVITENGVQEMQLARTNLNAFKKELESLN